MFNKKKSKEIDETYLFLIDELTPLLHSNGIKKGTKKLIVNFLKKVKRIDDESRHEFIEVIAELSEVIKMESMMAENDEKINSMVNNITDMLEGLIKAQTGNNAEIEQIKISKIDMNNPSKSQVIGTLEPKKNSGINDVKKKKQWIPKQLELVISKNFITINQELYNLFVTRRNFELKESGHGILDTAILHVAILVDVKTKDVKLMYLKSPEMSELYPFCFELMGNNFASMVEDDVCHFHEVTNNIFLDKNSYIIPIEYSNGENVFVSCK